MHNDIEAAVEKARKDNELQARLLHRSENAEMYEKNLDKGRKIQWRIDCALSDLSQAKVEMADWLGNRFYM